MIIITKRGDAYPSDNALLNGTIGLKFQKQASNSKSKIDLKGNGSKSQRKGAESQRFLRGFCSAIAPIGFHANFLTKKSKTWRLGGFALGSLIADLELLKASSFHLECC